MFLKYHNNGRLTCAPQAQVSQPCRPAPSRTRGKLRHAHGLTFQDIPGSAMVTAPAVPGVPVPNNAGPIAVPLLRFAAATVPSDCDNSANAPATTTPPSKPAALWAVMAMTRWVGRPTSSRTATYLGACRARGATASPAGPGTVPAPPRTSRFTRQPPHGLGRHRETLPIPKPRTSRSSFPGRLAADGCSSAVPWPEPVV